MRGWTCFGCFGRRGRRGKGSNLYKEKTEASAALKDDGDWWKVKHVVV